MTEKEKLEFLDILCRQRQVLDVCRQLTISDVDEADVRVDTENQEVYILIQLDKDGAIAKRFLEGMS